MAGSIVEYLVHPDGLIPKVVDGKSIGDVQTFAQTLIIISLTGIKQPPLMDNWEHLFNVESIEIVRNFQKDLKRVSKMIKSRNTKRHFKYRAMDPKILESSVSI